MTSRLELHQITLAGGSKYALSVGIFLAVLGLVSEGFNNAYYRFMPYEWWGNYESVEYLDGNDNGLFFRSDRVIHRDVYIDGVDSLHCDIGGGFIHYSSAPWKKLVHAEDNGGVWLYTGGYPRNTPCRLVSDIGYIPAPGYTKWQKFMGEPFTTPK